MHEPYHGDVPHGADLVLQDVRTLHGSQFKEAVAICASPPCQTYSWMAMPWSKAKDKAAWYREEPTRQIQLNELFDACFRIQREACEAAGRHIPLIVENVRGAIPWVGRSRWNFGSFHLWGDVPALMPMGFAQKSYGWFKPGKEIDARSRYDGSRKSGSAIIAKIPFPLSRHIARTFRP